MVKPREAANKNDATWTYAEVADFLRCSEETVRKKVMAGEIPHARVGRFVRFDPEDVRRWFDEQKVA